MARVITLFICAALLLAAQAPTTAAARVLLQSACNGCTDAACYCKTVASGDYANPFDTTCATFIKCSSGAASVTACPSGLIFNAATKVCDWPSATTCKPGCAAAASPSPSPVPSPSPSPAASPKPSPNPSPSPSPAAIPSPSPSPKPSPSPSPAPATACNGCTDAACYCKTLAAGDYANPFDATCATFIKCSSGAASVTACASGLIFNAATKVCDWPSATTCKPACANASSPSPSPSPSPAPAASPSPAASPKPSPSASPAPSPSPTPAPGPAPTNALLPSGPLLVGYYESWAAPWKATGAEMDLARMPAYVNVVNVAFAQPDCKYTKGSYSLGGTGLSFSVDGPTVRDAIRALKARNPNTRVMLAVGGATYTNFAGLNTQCIKDLVTDFGFDGADLDWEPSTAACTASGGKVSCPTDAEGVKAATSLRAALPKGQYLISTASFHVGLYGEGAFAASKPASGYTGINLAMARSTAGQSFDLVNIMSYDAGNLGSTGFDPKESFRAHRAAWPNAAIALGVEVPPEAWGGNVITTAQAADLASYSRANGGAGAMIWSVHKQGTPSAQALLTAMCTAMGGAGCTTALPA